MQSIYFTDEKNTRVVKNFASIGIATARKATKEVLGLSWQCGSSTPVIKSGKRSAGARRVSSDVPWRSLAKIGGRRCRQGGDVGLASREPRAVHCEAGDTQPGVAAVRVVGSVELASGQTCATSA